MNSLIRRKIKNPLIVICGPTATGKTDLALNLAKTFNGEIISCDSRQIYKDMDIGTGKMAIKRLSDRAIKQYSNKAIEKGNGKWIVGEIPIWLYDIVTPDKQFSASDFYHLFWKKNEDIRKRGKIPFLVGGTGFYIKTITEGLGTLGIGPDYKLREELGNKTINQLINRLKDANPKKWERMNQSDRKNPRRLIRAIETAQAKKFGKKELNTKRHSIEKLSIGLFAPRDFLYRKANLWVDERLKGELVKEVKDLVKKGYKDSIPMQGIIYKPTQDFLENKSTLESLREKLKNQMHDYIKRQLTWFKKDKEIIWFDISCQDCTKKVENLIQKWLN